MNIENLIFSDTETTGKDHLDFNQIIQSSSVLTDTDFINRDEHNVSCRPLPWNLPSPESYLIHKQDATLDSRYNHYEMMRSIHKKWNLWTEMSPGIFITYNGHRFDEELYRKQFFWNLLDPFVTNTNGNGRIDLLYFVRLVSQLKPALIPFELNKKGNPICSLSSVAHAIGIDSSNAHDARFDVELLIALTKFLKEEAGDLFEDFIQQATKDSFKNFLLETKVLGFRYQPYGTFWNYPLTCLGFNPSNPNEAICVDLSYPVDEVINLEYGDIAHYLSKPYTESPFKIIKINQSQSLFDASKFDFDFGMDPSEMNSHATSYLSNFEWRNKILFASSDIERKSWPYREHIEQTIYQKFFSQSDKELFRQFHEEKDLEKKIILVHQFNDSRAKEFAYRILFQIAPKAIGSDIKEYILNLTHTRWESKGPWPLREEYMEEIERLKETLLTHEEKKVFSSIERYFSLDEAQILKIA